MWAKLNKSHDHSRQPSGQFESPAGQPVLKAVSGNPLPSRNVSKDLPALPSEPVDTLNNDRVTSSVYSRNSVSLTSPILDYAGYSKYAEDEPNISPPDSPVDVQGANRYSDVSPIEPESDFLAEVPKQKTSQLPVPQKKVRINVPDNSKLGRISEGSPTIAPNASQNARGGSPQFGTANSKTKEGSKLLSAGKERLQMFSRTRDQKQREPKQPREQWKGATGRFPLIPPIDTKNQGKHIKKSNISAPISAPINAIPENLTFNMSDAYTVTTITTGNPDIDMLNSKKGPFKPRSRNASPGGMTPTNDPEPEHIPRQTSSPVTDGVTADLAAPQDTYELSRSQESTPVPEDQNESKFASTFGKLNIVPEPRSRFSASTYAPTEVAISPPGSSHSDVPPVPFGDQSPIMTRRRPVPSSAASIKSMKRKPISSDTPPLPEVDIKSLSPEEQMQYRVDNLESRRKQLSLRKDSIKTMLHELTEVIQPSSIAYDMATRDEVKKTVSSLKNELDDIGKEDHEIGLKLVRLYKNLNDVSNYEQTSLWVKRITS